MHQSVMVAHDIRAYFIRKNALKALKILILFVLILRRSFVFAKVNNLADHLQAVAL